MTEHQRADRLESAGWRLDDIDFSSIDPARVRDDVPLLLLLVASSFVESGTGLYASNLAAHFEGDAEVSAWLTERWEPEELRHGLALRTYVTHVWPGFDWERAHTGFMADYAPLCRTSKLEKSRGLEMAARCVVETGTTALYRALHDRVREPVLRILLRHISEDEVRHYKYFFRYFRKYQQHHRRHRAAVLGALVRRTVEVSREDIDVGLRHACAEHWREGGATQPSFDQFSRDAQAMLRQTLPLELASAMWLRPLLLAPRVERQVRRVLMMVARTIIARRA